MNRPYPERLQAPSHFNFAADVIDRWARERSDATGLWYVDAATGQERKFTFRELACLSCKAANIFRAAGLKKGDRVLVMLPRVAQWWVCMLGLIRLGAVPVPATLLLTARDVSFRIETGKVTAAITNPDGLSRLEGFEGVRLLVGGGCAGWLDFDAALEQADSSFSAPEIYSEDPGILYFTSATTGDPKMVLHSQVSYGLAHRLTGELWLDLRPGDLHWNISDLGWGKAAWSSFFGPWHMGACVFALDFRGKFDPTLALNTLGRFPITTWCAPPTALRLIVRQDLSRWRFPTLRHCVTAGEPLNPEVFNIWQGATGLALHEAYGQTESVVMAGNFRSLAHPIRVGSMGKQTPGFNLAVVDEDLREVPPGEEGEIAVRLRPERPLGLFREYWLNPAETASRFRGDFYLTGDRARRDAEGYFWFVGRKDDVIKSSGYRIGPFEVESAMLEHPAVLEVAVIGKPDALRGQIVKAFVVLRPGVEPSDELKIQLQQHCKKLVSAYKYPREIEFVADLPKTASGKTRHFALRQQNAAAGAAK